MNRRAAHRTPLAIAALLLSLVMAACARRETPSQLLVTVIADGRERAYQQPVAITVGEFLSQIEVEANAPDEVSPPVFTQLSDGMRITVVRVREESNCVENEIAYPTQRIPNESLAAGDERLAQSGQAGAEQVCYRVAIRDDVRQEAVEVSRVTLRDPLAEVVFVGPSGTIEQVAVSGTLAYLSGGNIWTIRGDSTQKRPLTSTNDVDGRAFDIAPEGTRLLFSRQTPAEQDDAAFNQLWMIADVTRGTNPIPLVAQNVLFAAWVPDQPNQISYSTAEKTEVVPGWDADNNLWLMEVDLQTGEPINARELVEASLGGLDGWWGTRFQWSPDGSALAWVRADSVGLVDLDTGALSLLLDYALFETRQSWSWRSTVSWSSDNTLLLTTVHGQPIGSEPAEASPAFHVAVTDVSGAFEAEIARDAGIWSMPVYAPAVRAGAQGGIAYLRARDRSNNVNPTAQYDLVIADRDGSNSEAIFPAQNAPGLNEDAAITWSPDGRQIAFIYQGNLWTVDIDTRVSHQLTLDNGASQPSWTR